MICVWFGKVAKKLIQKLETRLLTHGVMDVFAIVYLQYWSKLNYDEYLVNKRLKYVNF
jgi:hypothetical protein